jgi:hypothetical protein
MKKLSSLFAIGALLVAGAAQATPLPPPPPYLLQLTTGQYTGGNGGGEFTATLNNGQVFQTFCLEFSEEFYPGQTYYYSISQAANTGDLNNHGTISGVTGDPISFGTAALYTAFRNGTLADYFTSDRQNNATELQEAFWFLEDEAQWANESTSNNKYLKQLIDTYGFKDLGSAQANYTGTDVAVLNVTGLDGSHAQDQLYLRVPDGGATIAMLGLALLGLGFIRRRLA